MDAFRGIEGVLYPMRQLFPLFVIGMFSVRKSTKPLLVLVILLIVDRSLVPIALDQPHGHGLDPLVLAPVNGRFLALLT
jgi:hypothetical protein